MNQVSFRSWLDAFMAGHLLLDLPEPIDSWVRQHVELTREESKQFPGKFNPDRSPAVTLLFEFLESDDYDELIAVKSSQFGMTLATLAALMHKIKFNPSDVIYAINNREEIKRIGETRLKPMIRNTHAIAPRVPADEDKLQNMTLYLHGMTIYLIGGQSAGAAANKSAAWAIIDETDETPEELKGGESTIVDLLRDRLKRQEGAKLIVFSKPRNTDDVIWPEHVNGSRHRCFVPCPVCSGELPRAAIDGPRLLTKLPQPMFPGYQTLQRDGLRYEHCRTATGRWDYDQILTDTWYQCIHCGGRIEEKDKEWMLKHRLYIPTNTPEGALQDDCKTIKADVDAGLDGHPQPVPRKLSYQISDFYALHYMPRSTFGHLALEIVSANTESKRRKFRRSREGLPVGAEHRDNSRTVADIRRLQGNFARGHCSRRPLFVIMGVDVQHYGRKWVKMVFYEDDSCEVVDYGIVVKGYMGLLKEARRPVIVDDWGDTPEDERVNPICDMALIDEGDGQRMKAVLAFCTMRGAYGLFWPCKGRGGSQVVPMTDLVVRQKKNIYNGMPLPRYLFNADAFAEELYDERIGKAAEIKEALRKGLAPPAGEIRFYRDPDMDLCLEFTTHRRWTDDDEREKQRMRKKYSRRGRVLKVGDWFRDGGADDFGDAATECLVGWYKIKARFGVGLEAVVAEEEEEDEEEPEEDAEIDAEAAEDED
jgi:hypothetical protein